MTRTPTTRGGSGRPAPPATLTAHDQGGVRIIEVDCDHGTTNVAYLSPRGLDGVLIEDAAMVHLALLKHANEEDCACIADLWERFGLGRWQA